MPAHASAHLRLSVRAADAKIELAANQVLRRCQSALGLDGMSLPIPIEEWVEHPLGYRLGIVDAGEMGEGVLGLARPSKGEIEISDSLIEHEGRFRFTCAHELGHLILHAHHAQALRDGELPSNSAGTDIEHEADRFAAALLMPVETLAASLESVRIEQELSVDVLPLLRGDDLRTVWLWRRCLLPSLCDRYGVSRPAMVYRCREVRLPGQKRLLRPSLAPLLICPESALADSGFEQIRLEAGIPMPGQ